MQHLHKLLRNFLIARRQPSKLLDVVERLLNRIAIFVNRVTASSRDNKFFGSG